MARSRNLRRGLRPLSCPCGAKTYATWAQVETHGLPIHRCGEPYTPEEVEFALALDLDTEEVREFARMVHRFVKSQHAHDQRGHTLRDPHAAVAELLEAARAQAARANRINALRPAAEPIPF